MAIVLDKANTQARYTFFNFFPYSEMKNTYDNKLSRESGTLTAKLGGECNKAYRLRNQMSLRTNFHANLTPLTFPD